jgi:SAM-dependent methyltransferase
VTGHHWSEPSPWVHRFAPLIPITGAVLDLACGRGRHARLLAARGYSVEAVDRDEAVLASLADVAGITSRCADLEAGPWPYGGRIFAGIIVTNYLWRPLLPLLLAALDRGGVLIYETFMLGNERFGKPANPAFLLRPNELLGVVRPRLTVVAFEQGEVSAPRPAMVQRICAVRGELGLLP